jgi:hypothetical protein
VQVEASVAQLQWMLRDVRPVVMLCTMYHHVHVHVHVHVIKKLKNNNSGIPAPALATTTTIQTKVSERHGTLHFAGPKQPKLKLKLLMQQSKDSRWHMVVVLVLIGHGRG